MWNFLGLFLALNLASGLSAYADEDFYGYRRGYIAEVAKEREQVIHELLWIPNDLDDEKAIQKKIFDTTLTKEFTSRYEFVFGSTEAQRNIDAPNRFDELTYDNGVRVTPEEDVARKREFGEYMTRRLVEYHVDLYMKNSESVRPVYELKDAISNVNVAVAGGYGVNLNYSIAANHLTAKLTNPYKFEFKVVQEFRTTESQFVNEDGATESITLEPETIYYLGYPFSKRLNWKSDYKTQQGLGTTTLTRNLKHHWKTTLTLSKDFINNSDVGEEERIILGFTWVN
jgi:hypothetical protein